MMQSQTLQSLVDSLPKWGARPALGLHGEYGSYWYSYLDLHRLAWHVARVFAARNYARGSRIVLWADNSPELVACLLGTALRGLVLTPVSGQSSPSTVNEIVRLTAAKLVLFGPAQDHRGLTGPGESIFKLFQTEQDSTSIDGLRVAIEPSSEAAVLFTSGSSGQPNGVVLSHGNLMCQVEAFTPWRSVLKFVTVRLLALSPVSHVQGLVVGTCLPLHLGLSTLYTSSVEPEDLMLTIRLERIGILLAVPRILELLEQALTAELANRFQLNAGTAPKLFLIRALRLILGPRFRAVWVGGATLSESREAFWRRVGTLLIQGYGATETAAIVTISSSLLHPAGCVGKPVHKNSLRIAEDGEVLVRGPHLSPGYLSQSGDNGKPCFTQDGFFCTGDLAKQDRRKRLYLLGRKKEMIVTAEGHNVHPAMVERKLAECRGVRDSVVTGLIRDGLEEVHAVLLLEAACDADAIVKSANAQLDNGHCIRSWSVWHDEDFPRGALGKVKRSEVAACVQSNMQQERDATGPVKVQTLEECLSEPDWSRRLEKLAAYFRTASEKQTAAELVDSLRNCGLDSVQVIQLMVKLQDRVVAREATPVNESAPVDGSRTAAEPKLLPDREKPPLWQYWPGTRQLRYVLRLLTADALITMRAAVDSCGLHNLRDLRPPFLIALSPEDRRHPKDYLAVYKALPRSLARSLVFVMRSNPPDGFAPYLHKDQTVNVLYRWWLGALFHFGVPLWFPFTLFPCSTEKSTVLGMKLTAQAVGRGYYPLLVWGRGSALIATDTRATVVPVRLSGNEALEQINLMRRARVRVTFGAPINIGAGMKMTEVLSTVEERLRQLKHLVS